LLCHSPMVKETRNIAALINKAINSEGLLLISIIISRRDIYSCEIYDSHTFNWNYTITFAHRPWRSHVPNLQFEKCYLNIDTVIRADLPSNCNRSKNLHLHVNLNPVVRVNARWGTTRDWIMLVILGQMKKISRFVIMSVRRSGKGDKSVLFSPRKKDREREREREGETRIVFYTFTP